MSQSADLELVKGEYATSKPSKSSIEIHKKQVAKLAQYKLEKSQSSSKLNASYEPSINTTDQEEASLDQAKQKVQEPLSQQEEEDMSTKIPCKEFVYEGDSSTLGTRWETWLGRFELFLTANKMEDAAENRSSLLILMGEDAYEVFLSLPCENGKTREEKTLEEIYAEMSAHFVGKKSEFTEQCKFRRTYKHPGENVDSYHMRLRRMAVNCNFGANLEKEILNQLVPGSNMDQFQQKCCRQDALTLKDALELARGYERTSENVKCLRMSKTDTYTPINDINYVSSKPKPAIRPKSDNKCYNCGKDRHLNKADCPAQSQECRKCHKLNHFSSVCRSSGYSKAKQLPGPSKKVSWGDKNPKRNYDRNAKSIGAIETEEGCHVVNSQEYADYLRRKHTESLNINAIHTQDKESSDINSKNTVSYNGERPLVHLEIQGTAATMLLDTGAPVNVIEEKQYHALHPKPALQPCNTAFYSYTSSACKISDPLPIGQFTTKIRFQDKEVPAGLVVIKGSAKQVLSSKTKSALSIHP